MCATLATIVDLKCNPVASQSIAVVGNGPLSPAARARIQTFATVARFNNMDNRLPGEAVTLLYLRFDPGALSFHGLETARGSAATSIALVYEDQYRDAVTSVRPLFADRELLDVPESFQNVPYPGDDFPYPPYADKYRLVPSTGFFAIHHLMTLRALAIELFGFSWQGWRWHDWEYERRTIASYVRDGHLKVYSG